MRFVLWGSFFIFVAIATLTNWSDDLLRFDGPVGITRAVLIAVWIGFLIYSIYCSARENLFRTIGEMAKFHWGRQIGIDLYISVLLSIGLVYLVTGSVLETVLWAIPFIPFANQAILLFIILRLEDIIAAFQPVTG